MRIQLRRCQQGDLEELSALFYHAVHEACRRDYTSRQLDAWAPDKRALLGREDLVQEQYALAAVVDGRVVGYGTLDRGGYLDHLFVHPEFQRQGVASALCRQLEEQAWAQGNEAVEVHASITALPFFIGRGYQVEQEQQVPLRGEILTNYRMKKGRQP